MADSTPNDPNKQVASTKGDRLVNIYETYSQDKNIENTVVGQIKASLIKERFLELYAVTHHATKTCNILGIAPRNISHWCRNDPNFKERYLELGELVLQNLEDEAYRRAVLGTDRPVFQNGKLVGVIKEFSDTLLVVLLKARAPHKYKERFSGELTGADGKPLNLGFNVVHVHSDVPLAETEDEITQIRELEQRKHNGPIQEAEVVGTRLSQNYEFKNDNMLDDLK